MHPDAHRGTRAPRLFSLSPLLSSLFRGQQAIVLMAIVVIPVRVAAVAFAAASHDARADFIPSPRACRG